jgi:hypothetical protein
MMITNVFPVRIFPNPLYVAHLNHEGNPPENVVFRGTGVEHCFRHSNVYFWGDPSQVSEICEKKGWGYVPVDVCQVDYSSGIYDWDILQVLLYRAFNDFLRSNGFSIGYDDAYILEQPENESKRVVYTDRRRLPPRFRIHEAFKRSFICVQGQVHLVVLPRIVITELAADGRSRIEGPESIGWYTKMTFWRRADKEREMIQYWAEYLSQGESNIVVPVLGSSSLVISKRGISL